MIFEQLISEKVPKQKALRFFINIMYYEQLIQKNVMIDAWLASITTTFKMNFVKMTSS